MRRSVAILGPTPQFVRWAIRHECPLRQLVAKGLPDATFRQLRALRELSVALTEDRVLEGICVHPDTEEGDGSPRGFSVDETLCVFGDGDFVAGCCGGCYANAMASINPEFWAGCYGWLTRDSGGNDLVESVETAVAELELQEKLKAHFPVGEPKWYSLWQAESPDRKQLEILGLIFGHLSAGNHQGNSELSAFNHAIERCLQYSMPLELDLVPPGNSDGLYWTLACHCPRCKSEMPETTRFCQACGRSGGRQSSQRKRVLGIRPYIELNAMLGTDQTRAFLERYFNRGK